MNKTTFYKNLKKLFGRMFLVCLIFSTLTSRAQTGEITLRMNGSSVLEVMKAVEKQTRYVFFYNNIDTNRKIDVDIRAKGITECLDAIFKDLDIDWKIENLQIILSQKKARSSEPVTVNGRIFDGKGQPIIGAAVVVKGTTVGATTDAEGAYSLRIPPPARNAVLTINYLGYETTEVPVGGRTTIDVTLSESTVDVDAVVVTALGITRSEKALSYNVQNIAGEELAKTKDANIMAGLAGKIAGVQINASAAGIGGGTRVVMRGTKSISGNNNALYVIDGIPLSNVSSEQPDDQYTGAGQSGDAMSTINADDIESISVLNGSAAAALYGSAAANGVVLITTKKGAPDRTSVTYTHNSTFHSAFMLPRFQNRYGSETGEWYSWNPSVMNRPSNYDVEDFFQTGYNVANTVSLSTGNQKNQTYLSAGSVNARGIIQNNEFDRYTFTGRNTSEFLKGRMTLDLNAMYTRIEEQNMLSQGEYANPLVPIYLFPRGDDIEKYKNYERYDLNRNIQTQFWALGDNGLSMQNPWWITHRNMYTTRKDRFLLGAALKFKITDWLDVSGRVKYDKEVSVYERKMYASTLSVLSENSTKGSYIKVDKNTTQVYADVMLNVNKYFCDDKLSLTATAGASLQDLQHREESFGGGLKTLPNIFTFTNVDQAGKLTFKQNDYHDRTNSIFATVSLGYKGMVYVDASLRNDWISALAGTDHTSILYPSVGASALLTDIFDIRSKNLSLLKLRVSYSEVGNAPERFRAITTYSLAGGLNTSTYFPAVGLEPERTRSWEAGLNMSFFDNRLTLDVTGYTSETVNQLFSPAITSTTGYTQLYVNAGKVSNRGVEASLGFRQPLGPVKWSTNVLWSLNRNRVDQLLPEYTNDYLGITVKLDEMDVYQLGGAKQMLTVGGTMGDIYVNKMRTDEHGKIWVNSMTGALETDRNEWVKAGTSNPDYTLVWRNDFSWKGLSLGFMLNARIGGVGVSATQAVMDYYGVSERSAQARDNGGVDINGYKLDAQQWYQTVGGNGTNYIGSMYVYSMTNVRLGELTFGYDIPIDRWCKWIKGINVSFVGRNLWMLYCKAPFDPESTASTSTYNQGFDYFMQPSLRSLGFSVKVTF